MKLFSVFFVKEYTLSSRMQSFTGNMPEELPKTLCFGASSSGGPAWYIFSLKHAVNMVKTVSGRDGFDFEKLLTKDERQ